MYIRKFFPLLFLSLAFCASLYAQNKVDAREEIRQDIFRSGANYLAYPTPEKQPQGVAPDGYKPFYISTYMRHGSRYHISERDYSDVLAVLRKADSAGVLTAAGRDVMEKVEEIARMADKRLGELTPLGAAQHRGIAERMYNNFPEVFAGNASVDARSTNVIRCILSMTAECLQLQTMNPDLQIFNDASLHDMCYMNHHDKDLAHFRESWRHESGRQFRENHVHPERLMKVLFKNVGLVTEPQAFMEKLFYVAINMQCQDEKDLDFLHLFTLDECYDLWQCRNVDWYLESGDSPITARMMPYKQTNLLANIIDTADEFIAGGGNGATLRFGHDGCLMALLALMEAGDCGYVTSDMETLAEHWQCYRYIPMASNIQLVFYRNSSDGDVLVRALLNENEVSLPVKTDCWPFYRWADVEDYWRGKLSNYILD